MGGLKLLAEIGLDGSGFEHGMEKIGHTATHNLKHLIVGAFGFYGVEQAIHKTIETAEELVNESKRLDITVEQLQVLRRAAKDSGTEMEALAKAFEFVNIARDKIFRGDKGSDKLLKDFARLGVSPAMLKTQSAASLVMGPIGHAVRGSNVADISVQLRELLGKGFGSIIPVLKSDFEELEAKMKKLGVIMDTDTAVKLKLLGEEFSLLSQILVVQLGPALLKFTELIIRGIGKLGGAAAYWGGGTSDWQTSDWLKRWALGPLAPIVGAKPFSNGKGLDQMLLHDEEFDKALAELKERLAEEAAKLKNPKPLFGDGGAEIPDKVPKTKTLKDNDALLRVGNFLGSTGNVINHVESRKIQLLTKIAKNTEPRTNPQGNMNTVHFPH